MNLLSQHDLESIKKYLREEVGDYNEKVLLDEVHAWLAHDQKYLEETGFNTQPYLELSQKLRELFDRYK